MVFIIAIVVFLITVIYVWYAFSRHMYSFNYWQKRNIPCIEPTIPFGNLEGVGEKFHIAYVIKNIYDTFKKTDAKYCGAYFYTRPIAIILDLKLIKEILVKDFTSFTDRGLYYNQRDDPLSANLSTLDYHEWRKLRTKLSPTFTSGIMKFMFSSMVEMAERLRNILKETILNGDDVVEIRDVAMRYTADIIGTCAFGIECNSLRDSNSEFLSMGRLSAEKQRHSAQFLAFITSFSSIARMLRIKAIRDDVSKFFMNVVKDTVYYREKNNIRRNDFMDILLSIKNQKSTSNEEAITLNEIAAQTNLFFTAGLETSSTTITNCLFELAGNPEIQTKARQSIQKAYEKHDCKLTYEMIMDMPYIYQIVQGLYLKKKYS